MLGYNFFFRGGLFVALFNSLPFCVLNFRSSFSSPQRLLATLSHQADKRLFKKMIQYHVNK